MIHLELLFVRDIKLNERMGTQIRLKYEQFITNSLCDLISTVQKG